MQEIARALFELAEVYVGRWYWIEYTTSRGDKRIYKLVRGFTAARAFKNAVERMPPKEDDDKWIISNLHRP
jgi:hypothetical protein